MGNCCAAIAAILDSKNSDYQLIPDRAQDGAEVSRSSSCGSQMDRILDIQSYLPPEFLKIYEIRNQLGVGTTSKVYTVRRKRRRADDSKDLACKIIDKRKLTQGMERRDVEPLLTQLRKEVDILRRINHQNVVEYVDFMESRDKIIIITEKLPGGELFDHIIAHGPLSEDRAREVLYGVFAAVAYLHARGVIHRDIKAENLIFFDQPDGRQSLKMIDFGFSTILKHSLTGSFLGTGGYIAPEIRQNKQYSTSVDNWALGVLLFCTLSAKLPFPVSLDELPADKDECRKALQLRFPRKFWATVSEDCKDLIARLLEVDPMQRITAKEALQHPWFGPVAHTSFSIRKRVVATLSGTTRSSSFASLQNLEREGDTDDFHNPYWELPALHEISLRRSVSMSQVEQRAKSRAAVHERPAEGGRDYLLGGDRCSQHHSDASLTSTEAGSDGGFVPQALPPPSRAQRTQSFGYDEMHDPLAGDLFYSTYFH